MVSSNLSNLPFQQFKLKLSRFNRIILCIEVRAKINFMNIFLSNMHHNNYASRRNVLFLIYLSKLTCNSLVRFWLNLITGDVYYLHLSVWQYSSVPTTMIILNYCVLFFVHSFTCLTDQHRHINILSLDCTMWFWKEEKTREPAENPCHVRLALGREHPSPLACSGQQWF